MTILYKLCKTGASVIKQVGAAPINYPVIPDDPLNTDWVDYQAWLALGNTAQSSTDPST